MRRAIKLLGALLLGVILLALLAGGTAVFWATRDTNHAWVARLIPRLTASQVVVRDLSGDLLASPHFGTIEIRDAAGTWAIARDVGIDWSPLRLVHRDVRLERFSAARVDVLRRPVSAKSTGKSSWYGFRVDIDKLTVGQLGLAPPVIGARASLAANGSLHLTAADAGKVALALNRLDAAGAYRVTADYSASRIDAAVSAAEPSHGLIAAVAHVPDIGALRIDATVAGPQSAEATTLAVQAGALRATAHGDLDLVHRVVNLDVAASAPAMTPRPDLSWRSVALDAHMHGPFTAPNATGTLQIAQLAAAGATIARLSAELSGNSGHVALRARAEDVRVPGPNPDLLSAAPVLLSADARLDAPGRPVSFDLSHPLLTAKGQAQIAAPIHGSVAVQIPALAPLAQAAGLDLQGHAAFQATFAVAAAERLDLNGTLAITGGQPQAVALIGTDGRIGVRASLTDGTIALSRLHVGGRAIDLAANGTLPLGSGKLDLGWKATLDDLRAALPTLTGRLAAEGRVQGTRTNLSITAKGSGEVGAKGIPQGPVRFEVSLKGLPSAPSGHVTGQGVLDRAPLALALDLSRSPNGVIRAVINRAAWKSAHAEGTLTLAPHAALPQGRIAVDIGRLDDLRPFVGEPIGGAVHATAELAGASARMSATVRSLRLPGMADIAGAELNGSVAGLMAHPAVDARLAATGIRVGSLSGSATIGVRGPEDRLGVQLAAKLNGLAGAPAAISGAATIDAPAKTATLATFQASWKGAALHLLAPAQLAFGATKSVQHLRLGLQRAVLEVNGRIAPALDLRVAASNVTPDLARIVVPNLQARGTLNAEARLTGTLAHPLGTARLTAAGLRMTSGPGRGLPPANLSATATLAGYTARVDAHLAAGAGSRLTLAGSVALAPAGRVDLRTTGSIDLAMLNPLTAAQGVLVRGRIVLNAGIAGPLHAPAVSGTVQLASGDVQDFTQGVHLGDIRATVQGAGNAARISQFSARAGRGVIRATGSIGVLAPGIPVALNVTMSDAKPLSSNLVTATLDANLALAGTLEGQLRATGTIHIRQADITVPEHMPASVAVLPVRIAGQPLPPPPSPGPDIALDLSLAAPRQIYVRGRGISAELGGSLRLRGTARDPRPSGAFRMVRGQFSIAGTTLNFTEGDVTFTGHSNVGSSSRIDPALHFVATSSNANVTATLTVGGFASNPKISLSSVPELPQDEVLAHLLFGQSVKNLSPFQIAEIGSALAEFSGLSSVGIGDPLNRLRNTLGLDRLTIGTNPVNPAVTPGTQQNNTNTVMQAGRYVAPGVYLGATQGIVGGNQQTGATLQIDLTKHLKLRTGAGSGQGANNIGLTYQFQY